MRHLVVPLLFACLLPRAATGAEAAQKPTVDIGSRVEMFVDKWLIAHKQGVELRLHSPERREVVLTMDRPWENETSAYYTVFQDGPRIRMYYRGFGTDNNDPNQPTCYADEH